MNVLFYTPSEERTQWMAALRDALPGAAVREWANDAVGGHDADYAILWRPPSVARSLA